MKIKDREKEKEEAPSPQPEKVFYDNRIKRKNVLALNEKVAAIREYEKMPVYKRIGRMFHCSPDQIKRIVQQKDVILKAWEQRTRRCQDAKTLELKVVRVSMLGKAVYDWIRRMMYYKDIMITDGLIQKMALQFKSAMGLQNFFPHQEWCDKFRLTYKITSNDSKLLSIGHTQGFSVQIKDVMKDVLSECTQDDNSDEEMDSNLDDEDFGRDSDNDSDDEDMKSDFADVNSGERLSYSKLVLRERLSSSPTPPSSRNSVTATTTTTSTSSIQNQPHKPRISARPLSQLQPIRQLVALPIKTSNVVGGMSQKVLVATPITPSALQRPGAGGAPMTMTIIPFKTLTQPPTSLSNQASATIAPASAASVHASIDERPHVPPPMLEIKKEIKKEPEDIYIKQEYISDEETPDAESTANQHAGPSATLTTTAALAAAAELPEGAAVKVNVPQARTRLDDSSLLDDDNMALASLRLILKPNAKPQETTGGSATRKARTKQMSLRTSTTQSSSAGIKTTASTSSAFAPGHGHNITSTAIATAAASTLTSTSTSEITSSVPTTPELAMGAMQSINQPKTRALPTTLAPMISRSANKRRLRNNDIPPLPPIQTCSEARRYLKLLEDFALYKENFRLIGLITRADEVLRDLDGDNDIDID